jgi:hypothetical protein
MLGLGACTALLHGLPDRGYTSLPEPRLWAAGLSVIISLPLNGTQALVLLMHSCRLWLLVPLLSCWGQLPAPA